MRPLLNILIEMLFVGLFVLLIAKLYEPILNHGIVFYIAIGATVHFVFEVLGWNMQWCNSTYILRS